MASDPVTDRVSELLGKEVPATPALTKLRGRIERGTHAATGLVVSRSGESGVRKFAPFFVDLAMLMLAIGAEKIVGDIGRPAVGDRLLERGLHRPGPVQLAARGAYSPKLRPHLLDDVRMIVSATAVATMAVISFRVVVADDPYTSSQTALSLADGGASSCRAAAPALWASRARAISRGEGRPTLIVGAGRIGQPGRAPPDAAPGVRPHAGRLPRQRPAGARTGSARRCRCSAPAGTSKR